MSNKKPAPTQVGDDKEVPATQGSLGQQGGTSQPGPSADGGEAVKDVDFSRPESGEGGTDKA